MCRDVDGETYESPVKPCERSRFSRTNQNRIELEWKETVQGRTEHNKTK